MSRSILFNVDELILKGKNQGQFLEKLLKHLRNVLKAYHPHPYIFSQDGRRHVAESEVDFSEEVLQALIKVPGLHSIYAAKKVPLEFDAILPALIEQIEEDRARMVQELGGVEKAKFPLSFRVQTKRSHKQFPLDSMEISKEIGHQILKHFPDLRVDLHRPEFTIDIKIQERGIFVSTRKMMAVGGLPVGSSAHILTLISGGFDSPVASYLMSKRGCQQSFVFFYAYPFVGDEVKQKIIDLVTVLSSYQIKPQLYIIPYGHIQKLISDNCSPPYRSLIFRQYMVKCATLLAKKIDAQALLTGDALGQVSSQTLENIIAMDKTTPLPILRPLLGLNKIEIINLARRIGTHDISILPHDDACSLFAVKHPVTNPRLNILEGFSRDFPLTEELEKCIHDMDIYSFFPPQKFYKVPARSS